jgi:DNA-binding MarR family transcriptional regulator
MSPSYRLHKMVARLDRTADKLVRAKFGISYNRALFLAVLHGEGPLTQHNLATGLGYSDAAVSMMLSELATEGYVQVSASPEHGRKRIAKLTPAGSRLIVKIRAHLDAKFEMLLANAGVDITEYDQLNRQIYQVLDQKELDING